MCKDFLVVYIEWSAARTEWEGKEEDPEKTLPTGKYNFEFQRHFEKKLHVCTSVLKHVGIYLSEYNNIILVYQKSLKKA